MIESDLYISSELMLAAETPSSVCSGRLRGLSNLAPMASPTQTFAQFASIGEQGQFDMATSAAKAALKKMGPQVLLKRFPVFAVWTAYRNIYAVLRTVNEKIDDVKKQMKNEIDDVKKEMKNEINDVKKEMKNEIDDVKKEIGSKLDLVLQVLAQAVIRHVTAIIEELKQEKVALSILIST